MIRRNPRKSRAKAWHYRFTRTGIVPCGSGSKNLTSDARLVTCKMCARKLEKEKMR